jgi:hypothetical protein
MVPSSVLADSSSHPRSQADRHGTPRAPYAVERSAVSLTLLAQCACDARPYRRPRPEGTSPPRHGG